MARRTTPRATPSGARKRTVTAGNEERPLCITGLADYGYWWQVMHRAPKANQPVRSPRSYLGVGHLLAFG